MNINHIRGFQVVFSPRGSSHPMMLFVIRISNNVSKITLNIFMSLEMSKIYMKPKIHSTLNDFISMMSQHTFLAQVVILAVLPIIFTQSLFLVELHTTLGTGFNSCIISVALTSSTGTLQACPSNLNI